MPPYPIGPLPLSPARLVLRPQPSPSGSLRQPPCRLVPRLQPDPNGSVRLPQTRLVPFGCRPTRSVPSECHQPDWFLPAATDPAGLVNLQPCRLSRPTATMTDWHVRLPPCPFGSARVPPYPTGPSGCNPARLVSSDCHPARLVPPTATQPSAPPIVTRPECRPIATRPRLVHPSHPRVSPTRLEPSECHAARLIPSDDHLTRLAPPTANRPGCPPPPPVLGPQSDCHPTRLGPPLTLAY